MLATYGTRFDPATAGSIPWMPNSEELTQFQARSRQLRATYAAAGKVFISGYKPYTDVKRLMSVDVKRRMKAADLLTELYADQVNNPGRINVVLLERLRALVEELQADVHPTGA